jgi:hypothetical protein
MAMPANLSPGRTLSGVEDAVAAAAADGASEAEDGEAGAVGLQADRALASIRRNLRIVLYANLLFVFIFFDLFPLHCFFSSESIYDYL